MEFNQISRWFIYLGIGFIAAGLLFWLISKITSAKDFPGTLQFELGGVTCVFSDPAFNCPERGLNGRIEPDRAVIEQVNVFI